MQFRSTNSKYTHFTGYVVSNVDDSSHGVKLSGGSTGGVVEPAGDETNIALRVGGKGTGVTFVGNSSSPVQLGASTHSITGIFLHTVQYTPPAVEASSFTALSTITVVGLTTNAGLIFTPRTDITAPPSTDGRIIILPYCSTAGELKLVAYNQTGSTISAQSTSRGVLTEFRR